jgi:hypothetical protein
LPSCGSSIDTISPAGQPELPAAERQFRDRAAGCAQAWQFGRETHALASGLDRGTAGDRYQVVVHVDPATLAPDGASASDAEPPQAVVELESGGTCVSAETAQRIACDASVVVMRHGPHGSVLDVGRKRRTAPPPIRRALAARDRHCQFPGCTARPCDAHHLQPWALGGRTSLNGLILLCRRHHTAVHEGGLAIQRGRDGTVTVVWPDGRRLDSTPPLRTLVEIGLPAWPPKHTPRQRW